MKYRFRSEVEFEFQHFIQFKRPDHEIKASYLTPNGPMKFNHVIADVFDATTGEILFLHGCRWHG